MRDLIAFPDDARVWIYQGNKAIPDEELSGLHHRILEFAENWSSHQVPLSATGTILHNRFIVLVVDESKAGVSGCSMDKATHFVQAIGYKYGVDFFDRNRYTYLEGEELHHVTADDLKSLYDQGRISDDTLIYDNLVNNKRAFIDGWVKPIGESWIKRVVLT